MKKRDRKVETLEATIAQQQQEIDALTAGLKEQAARTQKVNAQLAAMQPTTRLVTNE